MEDDAPVIYGLEFQARALTAQVAETEAIRFFVGTQSLRFDNQVHQIDFDDENNLINRNVFMHRDGEIWSIIASPLDKNVLATVYNNTSDSRSEMQVALWRIPGEFDTSMTEDSSSTAPELEKLTQLKSSDHGDAKCVLWHPSGEDPDMITVTDKHILRWDVNANSGSAQLVATGSLEAKGQPRFSACRWNSHHNCTQVATATDTAIRGWDLRTMTQVYMIENAHGQHVRDLDFNPNKQYHLVSCGDDCRTKFWDVRNPSQPVKVVSEHSHWVWSVRYNHFHDQLVLTSSSDSRVVLHNAASVSSEPYGHLLDEEDEEIDDDTDLKERAEQRLAEGVVSAYEEHEDSVYAAEWSTADPWLFASLSYDGRLVINRVPRAAKYSILL